MMAAAGWTRACSICPSNHSNCVRARFLTFTMAFLSIPLMLNYGEPAPTLSLSPTATLGPRTTTAPNPDQFNPVVSNIFDLPAFFWNTAVPSSSSSSSSAYPFRPNPGSGAPSPFSAFNPGGGDGVVDDNEDPTTCSRAAADEDEGIPTTTNTTTGPGPTATSMQDDEIYAALLSFMTQGVASVK
jgi:hypothetical protein